MTFLPFPKNFFWGASTSSHQIEGHQSNDWSEWEKTACQRLARESEVAFASWNPHWQEFRSQATDPKNYLSGAACDHWNRYEEDFDILQELHLNSYRFSLEWSRLEPPSRHLGYGGCRTLSRDARIAPYQRDRALRHFVALDSS
ncbi:MAG: family 1 glycosylhydrolase [Candidatus Moraniibacteriota bacterium]